MITNNNGCIINNIHAMAESTIYKDYIAFQDADGAIFHIKKTELTKLYLYMLDLEPIIKSDRINHLTQSELDKYFFEKS